MGSWMNGVGIASTGDFYGPDAGATVDQSAVGDSAVMSAPNTTIGALSNDTGGKPAIAQHEVLPGLRGVSPLLWVPLGLGALVLLRIVTEWGEDSGEFKNPKAGLYFGVQAAGWSILLIPLVKAFANKYHIHGLTEYINNA